MAQCVQFRVIGDTYGSIQLEQPVLVSEPIPISQCQGYLLLTPQEFSSMNNPFFMPLSIADGLGISFAIGSLWALAFIFKAARRLFSSSTSED